MSYDITDTFTDSITTLHEVIVAAKISNKPQSKIIPTESTNVMLTATVRSEAKAGDVSSIFLQAIMLQDNSEQVVQIKGTEYLELLRTVNALARVLPSIKIIVVPDENGTVHHLRFELYGYFTVTETYQQTTPLYYALARYLSDIETLGDFVLFLVKNDNMDLDSALEYIISA